MTQDEIATQKRIADALEKLVTLETARQKATEATGELILKLAERFLDGRDDERTGHDVSFDIQPTGWDARCKCGHKRGQHKGPGGTLSCTLKHAETHEECGCETFRLEAPAGLVDP